MASVVSGARARDVGGEAAEPAPWSLRRDGAGAALAAALSLVVAVTALHLWSWPPSLPLSYTKDAIYYDGVVKGTLDNGWYLHNPAVGAPFGLDNHDFPVVSNDSLQLLIVKAIGLFVDRPFLASNAFYLLTFPLNAVAAFAALRWRRTPRLLAVLGGAAFGILPSQFMKGSDYLFFVSAYMVPIGCAMVLTVLADEPLLRRRPGVPGLRGLASWRTAGLVLVCAAIASASVYYAVFTSILLGTAAVVRAVLSRSRRALAEGVGAVALIGAFVALNQIPTILYRLRNGPNLAVAVRDPQDAELYGLKLIQLVLPIPGHRISPLADLTDRYRSTSYILGEASTSIGLLASVGLAWLLILALLQIVGSKRRPPGTAEERNAAFSVVLILLWATTGGIATLVSYTVTSQLRTWSRMSVYVGFFGMVGALGLLAGARRRLPAGVPGAVAPVLVAVLFVAAALDQTSPRLAPDRAAIERDYESDAEFVRHLEALMPPGSAILQLPYVAYPEGPLTHRMGVYDELRPYLHSTRLRWSFGAMRGRPEDWHSDLTPAPLRSLLAGAAAGGLTGLVVDRFGYTDGAAALEAELAAAVGAPAVVGRTNRLAFWDLRPLVDRLQADGQPMARLSELTLRPLRLGFDDRFYREETGPGIRFRWTRGGGTITIDNPRPEPQDAFFSVTVRPVEQGTGTTTFHLPDGTSETVPGVDPSLVRRRLRVPGGRSTIRLETTAPALEQPADPRRLVARLVNPVLVPLELCAAAAVLGAPDREGGCLETSGAHRP